MASRPCFWNLEQGQPLSPAKPAGFALLIVVTLLAFLVVLLVGLAAYTRIETAVAGNVQRQAQARENALLALNVALGQLQKYAGPDQRVTATAESAAGVNVQKSHYTGVWHSNASTTADPVAPLAWLVSGIERGTPENVTAAIPAARRAELVGVRTVGTANSVVAPLQDITAMGIPGTTPTAQTTIGRYAWWVGDQGVKAPVAVADTSSSVTYAPYGNGTVQNDLGKRIRQQVALGAGAADAAGAPIFEPRDANNTPLVRNDKITATNQLAFLKNPSNTAIGLTGARGLQQNFHTWAPTNLNVLANTKAGGLRQDLSLDPSLLGGGFTAWANYTTYMEDPALPAAPLPVPAYSSDPLRRRYRMSPWLSAQGVVHSVAPVLSFFGLSFSVRESSSAAPQMEVAARCVIGLWNPYSAALVHEGLKVEVSGLPTIQIIDNTGETAFLSLEEVMGGTGPMRLLLPIPTDGMDSDKSSWLPGRVYDWAAPGSTLAAATDNPTIAHHPDATPPGAGEGIVSQTQIAHGTGPTTPAGSDITRYCMSSGPTILHVRILRASDDAELASYDSPPFQTFGNGVGTTPLKIDDKHVDFAFVFRLPETDELPSGETDKWLSATGRDPRAPRFPGRGFIAGTNGDDPAAYGGPTIVSFAVRDHNRLLDRAGNSFSYTEDTPVFELLRAPLLSLGQLQHVQLDEVRPLAIGNSWNNGTQLNGIAAAELFDRFYFSGLAEGVTPTSVNGTLLLPNPLLRVLRNPASGGVTTLANLQTAPEAHTSKFILQGGTFNLNSVHPLAWAAVMRGVRFVGSIPHYLDVHDDEDRPTTPEVWGTAADADSEPFPGSNAAFFRFAQSAQETYKAGPSRSGGAANREPFRKGMRTLTATQVSALAAKITDAIKNRHATSGPFRTLEEFLSSASPGTSSLLEQAIVDAGINDSVAEFSSQWLTQGDIMTALAPVLFPRSDTFLIRTYGEVVNPATQAVEGRAWCEATVQRVPEYFDKSQPEETPPADLNPLNAANGRRFKVVSFRWLTRSDI